MLTLIVPCRFPKWKYQTQSKTRHRQKHCQSDFFVSIGYVSRILNGDPETDLKTVTECKLLG